MQTCTFCGSQNTGTHYEHVLVNGTIHFWDQLPSPNNDPDTGAPQPQPCPVDGCIAYKLPGVPDPPSYDAVHTFCLDCGTIMPH